MKALELPLIDALPNELVRFERYGGLGERYGAVAFTETVDTGFTTPQDEGKGVQAVTPAVKPLRTSSAYSDLPEARITYGWGNVEK